MDVPTKTWLMTGTGLLLFVSKALDIVTTVRHLSGRREANPIARWVFDRFGLVGGMAAIAVVYTLIVLVIGYWFFLETNPILLYATVAGGLFVSAIQFVVSYANATGFTGWPISALGRFFASLPSR